MIIKQIADGLYEARSDRHVAYAEYMSIAMLLCMRFDLELEQEEECNHVTEI